MAGEAIYEKLVLLRAELDHLLTLESVGDASTQARGLTSSDSLLERQLVDLFWLPEGAELEQSSGALDAETRRQFNTQLQTAQDQLTLITIPQDQEQSRIFVVGSANSGSAQTRRLVAEVNTEYLWDTDAAYADQTLCVIGHTGVELYCSETMGAANLASLQAGTDDSFTGSFEWQNSLGDEFQATYWSIFLDDHFGVDDWKIFVSTPRDVIFSPLTSFQNTFVLVIIASLMLVLLLSSNQIKRILTPLRLLTQGTQEFARTNFSNRVVVNSNDEFSDLANSFNSMGTTLADQFLSLETMAEIDRLILSSVESDSVIEVVLERIQNVIGCGFIGISVPNESGEYRTMLSRSSDADDEVQTNQIHLDSLELEEIKNNQDSGAITDAYAANYLQPLTSAGAKCCFVLPLFYEGELSAIIALGYREEPENAQTITREARSWADRVAVALSNAKWQEKLYHQANYDALSGLPNRFALKDYLGQALNRAERNEEMVGVLYIDLDRFKLINDSLGHAMGDEYLKEIAERICRCVRSGDFVARLGGDEFTVVISDSEQSHHINTTISAIADKLLEVIPEPLRVDGHDLRANASIGISLYPTDAETIDDLMKNADSAMYFAKAHGGACYHYHSEELNAASVNKLRIENGLRDALENDELELHFQPQFCVDTGELLGAESLLRWDQQSKNPISPSTFLQVANETQLIAQLDLWVLREACAQLQRWAASGLDQVTVTINLSSRFFQLDHLAHRIRDIIDEFEVDANRLEFELTESTMLDDLERTVIALSDLSELGIKLTIDDFGIGYSSLAYLQQLPINKLKIGRTFVAHCHDRDVDSALVKTILAMAQSLNLECLASGVELEAQRDFLADQGCRKMQGYLFSPPVSAGEFQSLYTSSMEQVGA